MADELEAIALEDAEPHEQAGDEADAPADTGRPPDDDGPPPGDEEDDEDDSELQAAPLDAPLGAVSWRVANSLLDLRREIDARWPNRDRRTDGTIGDIRHCGQGRTSDHCPNSARVVRALDIDSDGIPTAWLAEHIRKRGANGDPRLAGGGYVIFNRRIASEVQGWVWRAYTGDSPHTDHIHVSVSKSASGYDAAGKWRVRRAKVDDVPDPVQPDLPKHPLGTRVLQLAEPKMRGTDVAFVQRWVGADDDGVFGDKTRKRVMRFQGIVNLPQNGIVETLTWRAMRVA